MNAKPNTKIDWCNIHSSHMMVSNGISLKLACKMCNEPTHIDIIVASHDDDKEVTSTIQKMPNYNLKYPCRELAKKLKSIMENL